MISGFFQFETSKHRLFVKRTKTPDLKLFHLNVGSTVSVLNRQLLVMNFADERTKNGMEKLFQRFYCSTVANELV
jgi:hypothetical protein